MANIFESVAVNKIRHSLFNLTHVRKFSCPMGYLIPIQVSEVLPNETFHFDHEALVKFAPLTAPMMQEVDYFIEDFFVPNRLVWDNWERFITPSDDGTFPAMPYIDLNRSILKAARFQVGCLSDYMGIPIGTDLYSDETSIRISTLVFRAYQLIWNEYYRDQNLQYEIDIHKSYDGVETVTPTQRLCELRRRCWPKDYFTSALPNTQRGGDVTLPISSSGDARLYPASLTNSNGGDFAGSGEYNLSGVMSPDGLQIQASRDGAVSQVGLGIKGTLDLSNITSATVNELRQAVALQEYLELNMRVGGRPNEYILGNFGQRVPDYRIDRPQFINGYRNPIVVNEVDQTSSTESGGVIASQAANATGIGRTRKSKYHSYEHGFIISLFSVLPKATYQQGLPRKFTRFEPLDYANPKFGNLGEQSILNKEVYFGSSNPDGVFGYTPRYSEYKFEPSTVHGEFKTTLNNWHMGRIFDNEPALNSDFVAANPSTRPFAVEDTSDKLRVEVVNHVKALRPLPYYGTPKLL